MKILEMNHIHKSFGELEVIKEDVYKRQAYGWF